MQMKKEIGYSVGAGVDADVRGDACVARRWDRATHEGDASVPSSPIRRSRPYVDIKRKEGT